MKKDEELSPELYRVAREKGTETPFSGKYVHAKERGMYKCAVCGNELFSSDTKFDSGSGWPAFFDSRNNKAVTTAVDETHGMIRTEVVCKNCVAHLGHVFDDGPNPPAGGKGGKRYCINSVCLELEEKK